MSVETISRLASDDGSGDAIFWQKAEEQMQAVQRGESPYALQDVSRRMLGANAIGTAIQMSTPYTYGKQF